MLVFEGGHEWPVEIEEAAETLLDEIAGPLRALSGLDDQADPDHVHEGFTPKAED
jgi:hypothetical protein